MCPYKHAVTIEEYVELHKKCGATHTVHKIIIYLKGGFWWRDEVITMGIPVDSIKNYFQAIISKNNLEDLMIRHRNYE